ncbi:glycosyltransferase family 2 protein [Halorubrum halophilum]|uniref:glycosyltransferase family 2 protein n=1 Tax=Halorubrum halophilum TaxID=413816 RepID=UPI0009E2AEE1|nr:glycosyltransferase family 2 protein [Halorubrum halophilum]
MSTPVSAIIIAHNEEENLRDCIATLDWCDEVIVVDNESTDSTHEIASELADKTIVREVPPDQESFEILRQYGIDEATNEWILRIDADERIPESLAETLQQIIKREEHDVIKVPRKNFILDSWYEFSWPDYTTTLWKKGTVVVTDRLHQGIVAREDSDVYQLPAIESNGLIHYTHTSYTGFLKKFWNYTGLQAKHTEPSLRGLILEPGYHFIDLFLIQRVWMNGFKNILPALGRILTPPIVAMRSIIRQIQDN